MCAYTAHTNRCSYLQVQGNQKLPHPIYMDPDYIPVRMLHFTGRLNDLTHIIPIVIVSAALTVLGSVLEVATMVMK